MDSDTYECIADSSEESEQNEEKIKKLNKTNIQISSNLYKYIEKQDINIPLDIKIKKYEYHYKYHNMNKTSFVYRCKYASSCKVSISISLENIKNIINKETNENIDIEIKKINNNKHKCKDKFKIIRKNKIKIKQADIEELIKIINENPLITPSIIKEKLTEKEISLNDVTINNYLQKLESDYLKLLHNETINYNINGLIKEQYLQRNKTIINAEKNRNEGYIIFSSKTQMEFLNKAKQIYIDATSKSCPKNYYQILNINIKTKNSNKIIPIFNIIMTNKTYISYLNVFNDIKILLAINKIKIDWKNILIISDLENSLVKAIGEVYPNTKYIGSLFSFCACIMGICKKSSLF